MHCRRVLDDHHFLALQTAEGKLGDCSRAVGEETLFVGRIDPGTGHDLGAVARANAVLVIIRKSSDHVRVDNCLFDQ